MKILDSTDGRPMFCAETYVTPTNFQIKVLKIVYENLGRVHAVKYLKEVHPVKMLDAKHIVEFYAERHNWTQPEFRDVQEKAEASKEDVQNDPMNWGEAYRGYV